MEFTLSFVLTCTLLENLMYYAHIFEIRESLISVIINTAENQEKLLQTQEGREISKEYDSVYLRTVNLREVFYSPTFLFSDSDKEMWWSKIETLCEDVWGREALACIIARVYQNGRAGF